MKKYLHFFAFFLLTFCFFGCTSQWSKDVKAGREYVREDKSTQTYFYPAPAEEIQKRVLKALENLDWKIESADNPIYASIDKRRNVSASIIVYCQNGGYVISCTGTLYHYIFYGIPVVLDKEPYIPINYLEEIAKEVNSL